MSRRWLRGLLITIAVIIIIPVLLFFVVLITGRIEAPDISGSHVQLAGRKLIAPDYFAIDDNWLRKSNSGLWELYVKGAPYERGLVSGKLCRELIQFQENAFVNEIIHIIPSEFYRHFLKYFIRFFNRNLDHDIPLEYQEEIYGISQSASDQFSFIGNNYERMLNYHAAHDIGHALQDYKLVGCSSFAVWGDRSADHNLIIGRNFDFYAGDEFARNKIVTFCVPDNGYKFVSVSWAGMTGCVSGMNEKGLTVTINAAKSVMPVSAATPISIIVREILQYADNIEKAYQIASARSSFVSEIFLIGSARDRRAALIEKTPGRTELFLPDSNYIICSNHFQADAFQNDELNKKNIAESSSGYRYRKLSEQMNAHPQMSYNTAAEILRDQKGLKGADIGYTNEKSLNQLICHHSVIFEPAELKVWVSTSPYQLGKYVCYDLNKIFNQSTLPAGEIYESNLTIAPDSFLFSPGYIKFLQYRFLSRYLKAAIASGADINWNNQSISYYIATNPSYYGVYEAVGDYYKKNNEIALAKKYYALALTKEIPLKSDIDRLQHKTEEAKE